ncbi:MAG TPA: oligosaccharide flippase family protein [Candidatus Sulfotelmatobacter sp.]
MADLLDVTDIEQDAPANTSAAKRRLAILQSPLLWDSLSYFGSKVVPGFMGLISVPIFIRIIGLDEYGHFAVIVPLLMAFASASSGWLGQGILRFHPLATDARGRWIIFDRAVTKSTIASVAVTCVVLAAVLAGLHYALRTALISLAFSLSLLVYAVTLARFQAQLQPVSVLQREIVRSIGGFVFPVLIVLITGRKQFALILLGQAIAYTIACLPSLKMRTHDDEIALDAAERVQPDSSSTQTVRQLWHFGWGVGLWLLLLQMLPVIDRWAIRRFSGFGSAGTYASLYEVAIRSFSFLVFPLTQAAHPRIMQSWNERRFAASYRIIRYSILSQFVIFVAVLGGVSVLSHRITRLILGFNDPIAARMLPVLFVGGFLWQFALLLHKPLEIAQRTGAMLAAMAVVVVLNVIACFLFIPRFGYPAASYILVFSACAYILFTLCLTRFRAFRNLSPSETC